MCNMKVYDPILCMMVEKSSVKTNDKAGEMWYLYVDGKAITAFERWGAPVKEAKEYMKKNNVKGVGILKRIGRGGSFTITAKDESIKTEDASSSDVAMQILSNSKNFYDKYMSMIEKSKDTDTLAHIGNMADKDFDRMVDNLDRMFNLFSKQYTEVRNAIVKYKSDVNKAGFKKYNAVSKK